MTIAASHSQNRTLSCLPYQSTREFRNRLEEPGAGGGGLRDAREAACALTASIDARHTFASCGREMWLDLLGLSHNANAKLDPYELVGAFRCDIETHVPRVACLALMFSQHAELRVERYIEIKKADAIFICETVRSWKELRVHMDTTGNIGDLDGYDDCCDFYAVPINASVATSFYPCLFVQNENCGWLAVIDGEYDMYVFATRVEAAIYAAFKRHGGNRSLLPKKPFFEQMGISLDLNTAGRATHRLKPQGDNWVSQPDRVPSPMTRSTYVLDCKGVSAVPTIYVGGSRPTILQIMAIINSPCVPTIYIRGDAVDEALHLECVHAGKDGLGPTEHAKKGIRKILPLFQQLNAQADIVSVAGFRLSSELQLVDNKYERIDKVKWKEWVQENCLTSVHSYMLEGILKASADLDVFRERVREIDNLRLPRKDYSASRSTQIFNGQTTIWKILLGMDFVPGQAFDGQALDDSLARLPPCNAFNERLCLLQKFLDPEAMRVLVERCKSEVFLCCAVQDFSYLSAGVVDEVDYEIVMLQILLSNQRLRNRCMKEQCAEPHLDFYFSNEFRKSLAAIINRIDFEARSSDLRSAFVSFYRWAWKKLGDLHNFEEALSDNWGSLKAYWESATPDEQLGPNDTNPAGVRAFKSIPGYLRTAVEERTDNELTEEMELCLTALLNEPGNFCFGDVLRGVREMQERCVKCESSHWFDEDNDMIMCGTNGCRSVIHVKCAHLSEETPIDELAWFCGSCLPSTPDEEGNAPDGGWVNAVCEKLQAATASSENEFEPTPLQLALQGRTFQIGAHLLNRINSMVQTFLFDAISGAMHSFAEEEERDEKVRQLLKDALCVLHGLNVEWMEAVIDAIEDIEVIAGAVDLLSDHPRKALKCVADHLVQMQSMMESELQKTREVWEYAYRGTYTLLANGPVQLTVDKSGSGKGGFIGLGSLQVSETLVKFAQSLTWNNVSESRGGAERICARGKGCMPASVEFVDIGQEQVTASVVKLTKQLLFDDSIPGLITKIKALIALRRLHAQLGQESFAECAERYSNVFEDLALRKLAMEFKNFNARTAKVSPSVEKLIGNSKHILRIFSGDVDYPRMEAIFKQMLDVKNISTEFVDQSSYEIATDTNFDIDGENVTVNGKHIPICKDGKQPSRKEIRAFDSAWSTVRRRALRLLLRKPTIDRKEHIKALSCIDKPPTYSRHSWLWLKSVVFSYDALYVKDEPIWLSDVVLRKSANETWVKYGEWRRNGGLQDRDIRYLQSQSWFDRVDTVEVWVMENATLCPRRLSCALETHLEWNLGDREAAMLCTENRDAMCNFVSRNILDTRISGIVDRASDTTKLNKADTISWILCGEIDSSNRSFYQELYDVYYEQIALPKLKKCITGQTLGVQLGKGNVRFQLDPSRDEFVLYQMIMHLPPVTSLPKSVTSSPAAHEPEPRIVVSPSRLDSLEMTEFGKFKAGALVQVSELEGYQACQDVIKDRLRNLECGDEITFLPGQRDARRLRLRPIDIAGRLLKDFVCNASLVLEKLFGTEPGLRLSDPMWLLSLPDAMQSSGGIFPRPSTGEMVLLVVMCPSGETHFDADQGSVIVKADELLVWDASRPLLAPKNSTECTGAFYLFADRRQQQDLVFENDSGLHSGRKRPRVAFSYAERYVHECFECLKQESKVGFNNRQLAAQWACTDVESRHLLPKVQCVCGT